MTADTITKLLRTALRGDVRSQKRLLAYFNRTWPDTWPQVKWKDGKRVLDRRCMPRLAKDKKGNIWLQEFDWKTHKWLPAKYPY